MDNEGNFEFDLTELSEWYLNLVRNMGNAEVKPTDSSRLFDVVGQGAVEQFAEVTSDAWSKKVLAYEFPDLHKGYIVETGGIVLLDSNDEALLPYLRSCYAVVASIVVEGRKQTVVMHHGPSWRQIPLLIQALEEKGEIDGITIVANSHFKNEEESAETAAREIQKECGIQTFGKGIETYDGRSLQAIIRNSEVVLLKLDADRDTDPADISFKISDPIPLNI
jgi:hypothetical protein